jgi:hypothetical protein
MTISYDPEADAAYIEIGGQVAGGVDFTYLCDPTEGAPKASSLHLEAHHPIGHEPT